jgi:pimeloyl-ACP methyl ester carboxylesterase
MLHGNGMCGGAWEPIVKRVSHRLHCIAPDLRDHGDSGRSDENVLWDTPATDVAEFFKALGLRDIVLVAHSRGATAGLVSSAESADRIAGAYLIEPSVMLGRWVGRREVAAARAAKPEPTEKQTVFPSRQALFDAYKGRGGFRNVTDESLWAYVNYGTRVLPDGRTQLKFVDAPRFGRGAHEPFVWERIAKIKFPVLLVYGQESGKPADAPDIKRFLELVPARFELVPGTHNTAMEHPDVHAQKILGFLDQLEREGRLHRPARK